MHVENLHNYKYSQMYDHSAHDVKVTKKPKLRIIKKLEKKS